MNLGWGMVVAGLALGAVALFVLRYVRFYNRLFSGEHYSKVAGLLLRLRQDALAPRSEPAREPFGTLSSGGLAVSYSIHEDETGFTHHLAVSLPGRPTAHAVGDRFLFFLVKVLALPVEQTTFLSTPSTVHHAELHLTREEHRSVAAKTLTLPTTAEILAIQEEFLRHRIHCRMITDAGAVQDT